MIDLERITKAKRSSRYILPALSNYSSRRACRLNECGRTLMVNPDGSQSAYFCQQWKLCRVCAMRRSNKSLAILLPKIQARMAENTTDRCYLVTLTIKGEVGEDCGEKFSRLQSCVRRYMRDRNEWRKGNGAINEACKASGVFSACETTRGQSRLIWHWHAHQIWICPAAARPSQAMLSREWLELTGDSHQVNVQELRSSRERSPGAAPDPEQLIKDLCEVCKYAIKPQELKPEEAIEVQRATAGRHFTRSYGTLRFTAEEAAALAAEDEEAPEPVIDGATVWQWTQADDFGRGCYRQMVADAEKGIDRHPRLIGFRAVNVQEGRRIRELDNGVKMGRRIVYSVTPESVDERITRPGRLRAAPDESENIFN